MNNRPGINATMDVLAPLVIKRINDTHISAPQANFVGLRPLNQIWLNAINAAIAAYLPTPVSRITRFDEVSHGSGSLQFAHSPGSVIIPQRPILLRAKMKRTTNRPVASGSVAPMNALIFGILLYISDRSKILKKINTDFTNKSAIFIGLFQVLALIPGVSRSGITITAGRMLGFDRFDSAKISFFLSIPTLVAASILGIHNILKEESTELNFLAIVAVIFSFIVSYFTIALFLNFIKKFSLNLFIIYRIALSLIILMVVYL